MRRLLAAPPPEVARFAPKQRTELETQMSQALEELNAVPHEPMERTAEMVNISKISTELSNVMLVSAENLVIEAQNQLAQTKLWIEKLQQEVNGKLEEHARLGNKLKDFASSVLAAHDRFHESGNQKSD